MSSKESVKAVFPFVEDGIIRQDVFDILERSVGVPSTINGGLDPAVTSAFFKDRMNGLV